MYSSNNFKDTNCHPQFVWNIIVQSPHPHPTPLMKRRGYFWKMDVMGGGMGNFYQKWGRARNGGIGFGFIMGEQEIFKVSLHSWQRGANPLFYEDNPYVAYPTFLKFCSPHTPTPLACHLQPHPCCLFCCPVSLTE